MLAVKLSLMSLWSERESGEFQEIAVGSLDLDTLQLDNAKVIHWS
jgi:hypothetical protein